MAPKKRHAGNYLLRGIDPAIWTKFTERADAEGLDMRTVILKCVEAYVDGEIEFGATQVVAKRGKR